MAERKQKPAGIDEETREILQVTMNRRRKELEIRGGGPSQLSLSLREVIASRKIGRVLQSRELIQLWSSCVDESIQKKTRVVSLRNRVLLVEVSDSVLMSELANFHKRQILRDLQSCRPDMEVKNLKFRLNASLGKKT